MTSSTRTRTFRDTSAQAAAAAYIQKQNTTCEGCVWLQKHPRPQCKGEASDFFRMVRDTHYPRCAAYEVRKKTDAPPVKQEARPARHELIGHAERDKRLRPNRKQVRA